MGVQQFRTNSKPSKCWIAGSWIQCAGHMSSSSITWLAADPSRRLLYGDLGQGPALMWLLQAAAGRFMLLFSLYNGCCYCRLNWQQTDTVEENYQANKFVLDPNEGFGRNKRSVPLKTKEEREEEDGHTYSDDDGAC